MSLSTKVANALSFASLAGLTRAKGAKAEEGDKPEDDEKDKAATAEEDDAEAKAEDKDGDDSEKKDDAQAKKAEGDDDKEPDEDDEKTDAKKAAAAERARCKAIVAHGFKTGRAIEACTFAFDTNMPVSAATATLNALGAVQPAYTSKSAAHTASLSDRMSGVKAKVVGPEDDAGADASSPKGLASMILAAGRKASGKA